MRDFVLRATGPSAPSLTPLPSMRRRCWLGLSRTACTTWQGFCAVTQESMTPARMQSGRPLLRSRAASTSAGGSTKLAHVPPNARLCAGPYTTGGSARMDTHNQLIQALTDRSVYEHPTTAITVLQTHISSVVLTGPYAYKIKKPVNLGFVDFSTLAQRHFFCQEELRLNRRLAPQLYLEVVAIYGTPERPRLYGQGVPIEYAVKMVQFAQDTLLSHLIDVGQLHAAHIDSLASEV